MKVSELINSLFKTDQDAEVVIRCDSVAYDNGMIIEGHVEEKDGFGGTPRVHLIPEDNLYGTNSD